MTENQNSLVYEIDEKGERVLVRSIESSSRAFLRFFNRTSRPVDVWWRDYNGAKRHYVRLEPGANYNINSFVTHPWEFTDVSTRERYVINNNPIYRPPRNIGGMMYRTNWNITVGVRTLRHTVLLVLATHLNDTDAVNSLGLPRVLAEELKHLISLIHRPLTPPQRDWVKTLFKMIVLIVVICVLILHYCNFIMKTVTFFFNWGVHLFLLTVIIC